MTNREFFTRVAETVKDDELVDFAVESIKALDSKNEKRRNTPTKEQKANEEIMLTIKGVMTDDFLPASEIGGKAELSTQKAAGLLSILIKRGEVETKEIKHNKRTVKGYKLVPRTEGE